MKAHLQQLWIAIQASYWFWPSVLAMSAIILSVVTIEIDGAVDPSWTEKIPLVYSNQPDGARALLSTVAGSMITVTGVTFSLTLLAVTQATGQFGPRLLTNFMRDRGNQLTLGVFIATFLYCLMILRTVRSAEEPASPGAPTTDLAGAFVPQISVFTALLLTLASIGVLIYFIHHIPESMRLSNVVANVGRELNKKIDTLFPEYLASDAEAADIDEAPEQIPANFGQLATDVCSKTDGYLQTIDETGLMTFARKTDSVIQFLVIPGDFVSIDQPILKLISPKEINEDVKDSLRFMYAFGTHRTSAQDALFLVDQLVEVAARALSPGINDPITAMTCIDWLQSALVRLTQRSEPKRHRFDTDGELRVIAPAVTFDLFARAIFDKLRPYVAPDRNAAVHLMKMIQYVDAVATESDHRRELAMHADQLFRAATAADTAPRDLQFLRELNDMVTKDDSA